MTGVVSAEDVDNQSDLETPDSVQRRFGMTYVETLPADARAAVTMPMEHFRNPFTGAPTLAPLAVLVDTAAGIVNHYRRRRGQWTVSSELSMELSLDDVGVIGGGTVRSFFIAADEAPRQHRSETLRRSADTTFVDLMAARVRPEEGDFVLAQRVDPILNNDIDIVHEGTALRVGRHTAVGDAQAIGDDGKVALTARVTAYR